MNEFADAEAKNGERVTFDLSSSSSAFEAERLAERATVLGDAKDQKLMFVRPSGEIYVVAVTEGYGARSASLHVEPGQDLSRYQGREVWQLCLSNNPFMAFSTRDLAMQAFNDASELLSKKFKTDDANNSVDALKDAATIEPVKKQIWKEVAKVSAVVVVAIFALCMAVRGAANLLETPDEKNLAKLRESRHQLYVPSIPREVPAIDENKAVQVLPAQEVLPEATLDYKNPSQPSLPTAQPAR